MNKSELVKVMAEKSGLSKKDAEKALNSFMNAVADALTDGDSVQLIGFGTFKVSERATRSGRNPVTGETMEIKACKTPKFVAGKALKDALNWMP